MFKLSDYRPEREFLSRDYEGKPHLVTSVCRVNGKLVGWAFEKYNGNWRLHFVEHYEEYCDRCGEVVLYTKCWHYTDLGRESYFQLITWLAEEKRARKRD